MTAVRIYGSSYGFTFAADPAITKAEVESITRTLPGDFEVTIIGHEVIVSPDRWRLDHKQLVEDILDKLPKKSINQPA